MKVSASNSTCRLIPNSAFCKVELVSAVHMWGCTRLIPHKAFISLCLMCLCMSNTSLFTSCTAAGMSAEIVKSSLHKLYWHPQHWDCLQHWPHLVRNHPPHLQLGKTAAAVCPSHISSKNLIGGQEAQLDMILPRTADAQVITSPRTCPRALQCSGGQYCASRRLFQMWMKTGRGHDILRKGLNDGLARTCL